MNGVTLLHARSMKCPLSLGIDSLVVRSCLGDACMAWRWNDHSRGFIPRVITHAMLNDDGFDWSAEPTRPGSAPVTWGWSEVDCMWGWREPDDEYNVRRTGRCGMVPEEGVGHTKETA